MGVGMYGDDPDGERCVEEYGDEDHAVDGTLDEAQYERPSAIEGQFPRSQFESNRWRLTFEASFC